MLSIAIFAAAFVATPTPTDSHIKPACTDVGVTTVAAERSVGPQKLNQLPNANLYLGVIRTEDGCSKPVVVRYDIGHAQKRR